MSATDRLLVDVVHKLREGEAAKMRTPQTLVKFKYSAKTRLPSHVELSTEPTYWGFYTKNKYGNIRAPLKMTGGWTQKLQVRSWQSGIFGPA
jgi:hypothetical protein